MFRGTQINVRGYLQEELFLIDVKMSLGTSEVTFTQALEPLPNPE